MTRLALIFSLFITAIGCTADGTAATPAAAPKSAAVRSLSAATADNGWPDRRPVTVIMAADVAHRSATNVYGWVPVVRADPEAAMLAFRERVLKQDPQAVVFWDAEGQKYDHPVSYVGDMRHLSADRTREQYQRWCKFFTDRNIRVGFTVRPQAFIDYGDHGERVQLTPEDALAQVSAVVAYDRTTFGATVFYLDSIRILSPDHMRRLAERFADCLFFPEFAPSGYEGIPRVCPMLYADPRPYGDKPKGSFVWVEPDRSFPSAMRMAELRKLYRNGAIPMLAATWDPPSNEWQLREWKLANGK